MTRIRGTPDTAESVLADLDPCAASCEEMLVAVAWAVAGQLEIELELETPLVVNVPESDELRRVVALSLIAIAKSNDHAVVAQCAGPRSWYTAALLDADKIEHADESSIDPNAAITVPDVVAHSLLTMQLDAIRTTVRRLATSNEH